MVEVLGEGPAGEGDGHGGADAALHAGGAGACGGGDVGVEALAQIAQVCAVVGQDLKGAVEVTRARQPTGKAQPGQQPARPGGGRLRLLRRAGPGALLPAVQYQLRQPVRVQRLVQEIGRPAAAGGLHAEIGVKPGAYDAQRGAGRPPQGAHQGAPVHPRQLEVRQHHVHGVTQQIGIRLPPVRRRPGQRQFPAPLQRVPHPRHMQALGVRDEYAQASH